MSEPYEPGEAAQPQGFGPIVAGFAPTELRALLAATVNRLAATEKPAIVGKELAASLDDRERFDYAVPQWTTADGEARGLVLMAWRWQDRERAEREATDAKGVYNRWDQIVWEVKLGIFDPADLPIAVIKGWNYDVVLAIHQQIERLAPLPPALIAAELARLAGGVPPAATPPDTA